MKISELAIADPHGVCAQIANHMRDVLGFDRVSWSFWFGSTDSVCLSVTGKDDFAPKGEYGIQESKRVSVNAQIDDDWSEVLTSLWNDVAKIGSRERRELEQTMMSLGDIIEGSDKFNSEFGAILRERITAIRDEAGARLIEHQGAS